MRVSESVKNVCVCVWGGGRERERERTDRDRQTDRVNFVSRYKTKSTNQSRTNQEKKEVDTETRLCR